MKNLYLLPYGGLCNRINAIASTAKLAIENNIKLTIYWDNNFELSANFLDVFENINIPNITIKNLCWYHFVYFRGRKKNLYLPKLVRQLFNIPQYLDWSEKKGDFLQEIKSNTTYLATCHAIGEKLRIEDIFIPNSFLQTSISEIESKFSKNTIGVHIRRGDHVHAIQACSIEDFCLKMDEAIELNSDTKFYLATDSLDVKNQLVEKYSWRIIVNETPLDRTSVAGIYGAVIDLWMLSKSTSIIGSKYSMFSLVASELKGIELWTK